MILIKPLKNAAGSFQLCLSFQLVPIHELMTADEKKELLER